jgi:hypothetical protein
LYTPCVLGLRPSALFNEFLLIKKKGFFSSSRGLRQGDPLSTILFVIVMKALSKMISTSVDGSLLSGFMVGSRSGGAINISHIFFCG